MYCAERPGRLDRRVGQIAEQVQIAQIAERPRQVVVDEPERPADALEPHLHEDARRILDVIARRLHEPRHLPELREDAPGPLGQRRIVEQRLTGEARRQHIGVMLNASFPAPDLFELEQPRPDVRLEGGALDPLDVGQPGGIDGRQPASEAAERAQLRRQQPDG